MEYEYCVLHSVALLLNYLTLNKVLSFTKGVETFYIPQRLTVTFLHHYLAGRPSSRSYGS